MSKTEEQAPPATTAVARTSRNSVMVRMAERYGMDVAAFTDTLKASIMPPNTTNAQMAAVLVVADRYELDPFTKQIYFFPNKGGGIVPVVGIDGWYAIANRHPAFDGLTFNDTLEDGKLVAITARVHRKDRSHPVEITEYMAECAGSSEPWKRWPARMLRHKASIQAIRAAFGISGVYDPDEADRIIDTTATVAPAASGMAGLAARIAAPIDPPAPEPEPDAPAGALFDEQAAPGRTVPS